MTVKYDYEKAQALIAKGVTAAEAGRETRIPYAALYSWLRTRTKSSGSKAVKRRKRPPVPKHTTLTVPTDMAQLTASAVSVVVIRGTSEGVLSTLRGMNL